MEGLMRRGVQEGFQLLSLLGKRNLHSVHKNALLCESKMIPLSQGRVLSTSAVFKINQLPLIDSSGPRKDLSRFYSTDKRHRSHARKVDDSDSDSDSDDERERRGNSDFWRRKMRTFHAILDLNNDGVISFDDYKMLAARFESLAHLKAESKKEFLDVIKELWEEQWGEITPYNLVTVEQYLGTMHHVVNDKTLRKKLHKFLPYLFKAVDKDHSGSISVKEFQLFFKCLGLSSEDAAVAFNTIDTNNDGKLSMKEFINIGRQFFLTEDEHHHSKLFWGPLCPGH